MEAIVDQLSDYELEPQRRTGGKPIPDTIHAAIQMNLGAELLIRYRKQYRVLSELSLATVPDDTYVLPTVIAELLLLSLATVPDDTTPDVAVYPAFPLDYDHRTPRRADPPLACIEITGPPLRSPSQSNEEMVNKTGIYFAFGVKSCWIVVPAMRGIFVYDQPGRYTFFHGDDTLHDDILGIDLPLTAIFE